MKARLRKLLSIHHRKRGEENRYIRKLIIQLLFIHTIARIKGKMAILKKCLEEH